MEGFFRAAAGILLTVVLIIAVGKQSGHTAVLLSILVCCMAGMVAVGFLKPVIEFMQKLQTVAKLDRDMLQTLLKVVGIALVSELAALICSDAGNGALGKAVQYLASAAILWLSIPMLTALLELVEGILGGL